MTVATAVMAAQNMLGEVHVQLSLISTVETLIVPSACIRGLQTLRWSTHGITGMLLAGARRRMDKTIMTVATAVMMAITTMMAPQNIPGEIRA